MENIYGITISDFSEKIHFFRKKPITDIDFIIKLTKQLNKNLKINYNLNDHIANGVESKLMDSTVNSKFKVKICILSEVVVSIFYSARIDIYYINILCQRLIEAFYNLLKNRKVKIDMLLKRYHEIELLIDDFLYMLDPRLRIGAKSDNYNLKDMVSHFVYMQKFNKTGINQRSLIFDYSSKNFTSAKKNLENNKKLRKKIQITDIHLNNSVLKHINKSPDEIIIENKVSSNQSPKKNVIPVPRKCSVISKSPIKNNDNLLGSDFTIVKSINDNIAKFNSSPVDAFNRFDNKSIIPDNAIDSIISNLKDINFNPDILIKPSQNDIFSNNSIYDNNIFNKPLTSSNKTSTTQSIKKTSVNTLDDLLTNPSFFEPQPSPHNRSNSFITSNDESNSKNRHRSVNFGNLSDIYMNNSVNLSYMNNSNLDSILLNSSMLEDKFDPSLIRKQVRAAIIEKGILVNNKGVYEDIKFRGQIALELSNNFIINSKTLSLSVKHPKWIDNNSFFKLISDKNLIKEENSTSYKIYCQNAKNTLRLIEYNINNKIIDPVADFKVIGTYLEGTYQIDINCNINEKIQSYMKNSQMIIVIIPKSEIKIINSSHDNYIQQDNKITYTLNNFNNQGKFQISMMFETIESEFIEVVKLSYRYMDILPTGNNAEISYYDENNRVNYLDIVKKCMVEIRFIP